MARAPKQEKEKGAVDIIRVKETTISLAVIGTTPLVCNRLSEKAKHELLLPAAPKGRTERKKYLKHDPLEEYRASPYTTSDPEAPTLITMPGGAFKGAMRDAALDLDGIAKAEVGRLSWIEEHNVSIYGVPQIYMAMVRQAGMNRTPDVRTRAILPQWCAKFRISFVSDLIKETSIINLMAAAGLYIGVGDGRRQKGALSFGAFDLTSETSPEFLEIVRTGGRAEQMAAMEEPVAFDDETESLLAWFDVEVLWRGFKVVA